MNLNFIDASIKFTFLYAAVASLLTLYFGQPIEALALALGACLSCCNLAILKIFIHSFLITTEKNRWKMYSSLIIKVPVLYFCGYGMLRVAHLPPLYFLIGFSLIFSVVVTLGCKRAFLPQVTSEKS